MSRRNHRRRAEVRAVQVKEIDHISTPAPRGGRPKTATDRLMDYIMCNTDDASAMFDLFPLPGNVRSDTRV